MNICSGVYNLPVNLFNVHIAFFCYLHQNSAFQSCARSYFAINVMGECLKKSDAFSNVMTGKHKYLAFQC